MNFNFKTLLYIAIFLMTAKSYACPCGCGSVNTDSLFPGETFKGAVFSNISANKTFYDSDGQIVGTNDGSEVETGFSGTASISSKFSAGITASIVKSSEYDESIIKEPGVYGSYILNQYDFTRPFYPLSIIMISYSPEFSENMSIHRGYQTLSLASSNWFTIEEHNWGVNLSLTRKLPSSNNFTKEKSVDRGYVYGVDFGYTKIIAPYGQYGISYGLRQSTLTKVGGKLIGDSEVASDTLSVYAGMRVLERTNARLSLSKDSLVLAKNNLAVTNLSLTLSRTF